MDSLASSPARLLRRFRLGIELTRFGEFVQDDRGPLDFDNDVEGVNLAVECYRDRFAGVSFYIV